ncbi:MAG TPA: response regulator, partial [Gemmatimonadaceae bacterium]|nr:response regulator [Gemmatimonadaceae bacterium]
MTGNDTPLRVIIAEDEPLARQALRRFVAAAGGCMIVAEAEDLPSLRRLIGAQPADVLFLDITMPGGSGLDAVPSVPASCAVIFTTAHAEHAAMAYQLDAVDYLVKPFGQDRVNEALGRVRRLRNTALPATSERR